MKRGFKFLSLAFLVCALSIETSCDKKQIKVGGPYYYKSWSSYRVPFKPIREVTVSEAKKMPSFYEAYYDANSRVTKFTKYLNGKQEFTIVYTYRADGTLERGNMEKNNGEIIVQRFDSVGKLITPSLP